MSTVKPDQPNTTVAMLHEILGKLEDIERRQEVIENQINALTRDVTVVHQFQRSFASRLSFIENLQVDQPLHSTPIPTSVDKGA